jgi:hypothetical protein
MKTQAHPNPKRPLYLGMRPGDLDGKAYARFWNPKMGPLSNAAVQALAQGPVAAPLLPRLEDAPALLRPGDAELEDGFGFAEDGSLHVAVRTAMPGVSPRMVDWWFGWHGCEAQRYKLWHPRAHVHAQWDGPEPALRPGGDARGRYVGRTSFVDEYLGSEMAHAAIRFLPPASLGFDDGALADPDVAVMICARVSFADQPLALGYLVHHVRRLAGGSEMRSRFWIGGGHAGLALSRGGEGVGPRMEEMASRLLRRLRRPTREDGRDLLAHCAQEMAHLATFLPALYEALGHE